MEIKIALFTPNPGWETILTQQGMNFHKVLSSSDLALNECCLIIPNREIIESRKREIEKYILNGGCAIVDKETFPHFFDVKYHKQQIKYIIPEKNSTFYSLGMIDFFTDFYIPDEHSFQEVDKDCWIYKSKIGSGHIIILPFSVNELMLSESIMRKRFYANRKELPSEVVSRVNKGKIRELLMRIIRICFQKLNIPLVEKCLYPEQEHRAFIFRVDTDFCSAEDAKNLYKICKKYDIKATWFVDTHDERLLKDVYPNFEGHEIALHCEQHKVYGSYQENYDHLKPALDKLKDQDIDVKGFAAPFGEWNESLGRVLEDLGFDYSSEFALDYDDLPFYPYFNNHFSPVLQIPIHPISIGRLRRSHFNKKEMVEYYKTIIDCNFSRNIPAIIYHHPHHKMLDVIEEVFAYVKIKNAWNPTMFELSSWWKKRIGKIFSYEFSNDTVKIESSDTDMLYKIITDRGSASPIKSNMKYDLNKMQLIEEHQIHLDEKRSMRQFYWRDVLQNYEQRKAKKQ